MLLNTRVFIICRWFKGNWWRSKGMGA